MIWWLVGFGTWLGSVGFMLALLAAAKRGDRRQEYALHVSADFAAIGEERRRARRRRRGARLAVVDLVERDRR